VAIGEAAVQLGQDRAHRRLGLRRPRAGAEQGRDRQEPDGVGPPAVDPAVDRHRDQEVGDPRALAQELLERGQVDGRRARPLLLAPLAHAGDQLRRHRDQLRARARAGRAWKGRHLGQLVAPEIQPLPRAGQRLQPDEVGERRLVGVDLARRLGAVAGQVARQLLEEEGQRAVVRDRVMHDQRDRVLGLARAAHQAHPPERRGRQIERLAHQLLEALGGARLEALAGQTRDLGLEGRCDVSRDRAQEPPALGGKRGA
jgi:hypothetical protein